MREKRPEKRGSSLGMKVAVRSVGSQRVRTQNEDPDAD
jgi:hypothetical protein